MLVDNGFPIARWLWNSHGGRGGRLRPEREGGWDFQRGRGGVGVEGETSRRQHRRRLSMESRAGATREAGFDEVAVVGEGRGGDLGGGGVEMEAEASGRERRRREGEKGPGNVVLGEVAADGRRWLAESVGIAAGRVAEVADGEMEAQDEGEIWEGVWGCGFWNSGGERKREVGNGFLGVREKKDRGGFLIGKIKKNKKKRGGIGEE